MSYPIPEQVNLYSLKKAILDHVTCYTDEPREGEAKPPNGQIFAYYKIEGEGDRLYQIPLSVHAVKFAAPQLPSTIATLFLKL